MIILPIKVNLEHLNIQSYIRRQIKGKYYILILLGENLRIKKRHILYFGLEL